MFSGPSDRRDGLKAVLEKTGWECHDYDICNSASQDLLNDAAWEEIFAEIRAGRYDFVWMGTPCTTFSRARYRRPGPPPLRAKDHIYGLPKSQLTQAQFKQVSEGNYFVIMSAKLAALCTGQSVGWAIENPEPYGSGSSPPTIFDFPEVKSLSESMGAQVTDFDQCMWGAETTKPTRILWWGVDFSSLALRCNHEKREWVFSDLRGRSCKAWAAHPPLAGRMRDNGEPATKSAAAYPGKMYLHIAKCIISRGRRELPPQGAKGSPGGAPPES